MGAGFGVLVKGVVAFLGKQTLAAVLVKSVLINVALGAVSRALAPKAGGRQDAPGINVTVRGPIENRRLVLGRRRVGGVFAYWNTSDTTRKYLWYVVVLAHHQVSAIRDVWLDTVRIPEGDIDGSTGAVTDGQFAGKVYIWKYLGTSAQTADPNLMAAIPTEWTSDHRLRGCAYVVVRMERDDTAFPSGSPQSVTAIVDGALAYDARKDSTNGGSGSHRRDDPSTWEFTRNPALLDRWYATGGSVHNDQSTRLVRYGPKEADDRIDEAFWVAAANLCDEVIDGAAAPPSGDQTRYSCDLEVTTGETRRMILEHVLDTMAGTMTYVQGKWRLHAGAYETPTHALTDDDIFGDIEVQDTSSHDDRYNAVAAVFYDAAQEYIEQTSIFRTDGDYEDQDGGERIQSEIEVRGCDNQYRAQRLAEVELRRSRMMRTVRIPGALNLLKIAPHETFTVTHGRWGWTNRVFRCLEREFEYDVEAGRVILTARVEDPAVWNDLLTADYVTGTSVTDTFEAEKPEPPISLTIVPMRDGMLFSWELGSFWQLHGIVEIWRHSANSPFSSATLVWSGRGDSHFVTQNNLDINYYWITVRTIGNKRSDPYPSGDGLPGAPDSVAAVEWVARGGCVIVGTSVRKIGASGWNADVYSIGTGGAAGAPCHVQWKCNQNNKHLMVALNTDPELDSSYSSLDCAWYAVSDGTCCTYESGVQGPLYGDYTADTLFGITYDGSDVRYLKDGEVMQTTNVGPVLFHADSSFHDDGAGINSLSFGPGIELERISTGNIVDNAVGENYYAADPGPFTRTYSTISGFSGPHPLYSYSFTVVEDCVVWVQLDCTASKTGVAQLSLALDEGSFNNDNRGASYDIGPSMDSTPINISRTASGEYAKGETCFISVRGKVGFTFNGSMTVSDIELNIRTNKK